MEVNNYNTYFNVIFKCVGKEDTICHFFPQDTYAREQYDEINAQVKLLSEKYEGLKLGVSLCESLFSVYFPLSEFPEDRHDEILGAVISAMNCISGIKAVYITDNGDFMSYDDIEYDLAEVQDTFDDSFLDDVLGITRLGLSYPTHTEGIEGECFNYSVYFTDDTAGEEKAATVRNVVESFDFGLKDDDYAGYLSISADKDKVTIYLDLGNVQPGNENKVIHGILLALNNVQDIKSVIINEK
jgi:hypothetical protein